MRRRRKPRPPRGRTHAPLALIACDTSVRVRDGLRRDLFTLIDPRSRIAFARATPTCSSRHSALALHTLIDLLPTPTRAVLSDNGAECMKDVDALCQQRPITHDRAYHLKCMPIVNASIALSRSHVSIIMRIPCSMTWSASTAPSQTGWCATTPNDRTVPWPCNLRCNPSFIIIRSAICYGPIQRFDMHKRLYYCYL